MHKATAPYRAMWQFIRRHWMWIVPIVAVLVITILAIVLIDGGGGGSSTEDTWGTLFKYKDGKLDINYGNAILLAFVISFALSGLRGGKDD